MLGVKVVLIAVLGACVCVLGCEQVVIHQLIINDPLDDNDCFCPEFGGCAIGPDIDGNYTLCDCGCSAADPGGIADDVSIENPDVEDEPAALAEDTPEGQ